MNGSTERRATRLIAVALGVTTLAALALAVVYILGGQTQLEGILIAFSLGGLGYAFVVIARRLLPQGPFTEERKPLESSPEEVRAFARDFESVYEVNSEDGTETHEGIARRKLIGRPGRASARR
jgi:ubiquinol-cytochrome c reductase iron-sulfur subunit